MKTAEQIQDELMEHAKMSGLAPFIVTDASQVLDLGGELFIELVVSDASKLHDAQSLAHALAAELKEDGRGCTVVVRSSWSIDSIGAIQPAYGKDGGLRAAALVPVRLKSGIQHVDVTVSITKLAEMEFDRILGSKTDLRQVAEVVIENALHRGGRGFWNPLVENYLEVASGAAAGLSRLLKQTA